MKMLKILLVSIIKISLGMEYHTVKSPTLSLAGNEILIKRNICQYLGDDLLNRYI